MILTYERKHIENFNFEGIPASEGIFGIHKYPAMLHFKIAEAIIKKYTTEDDLVYDPFCGSGVTLNVATREGRYAFGTDINPLAILISKVRSYINIKPEKLLETLIEQWNNLNIDIPPVKNIDYWFKENIKNDLGKIRSFLKKIPSSPEKEFLLVVFSQVVRNVSLTRKNEFKRYRMKLKDIENFNPNVLEEFTTLAKDYLNRLRNSKPPKKEIKVFLHDVRNPIPTTINNINLIITSPPYGDSKTTVAYGEFFSFSLEWLQDLINYDVNINLDKQSLGGTEKNSGNLPDLPILEKTLEAINKKDPKRGKEVETFLKDLYTSIQNISKTLAKDKATICFIVGNRKVKGYTIFLDEIVKELFEFLGFSHYKTITRKILNKRLPLKNSPTNKKGFKSTTMQNEYIVIMKI